MPGFATVILGAGASFDCSNEGSVNAYRSPLVPEIFHSRFNSLLNQFPGARMLAKSIDIATRSGESFEQIMRRYWEKGDGVRARQFQDAVLYLQKLFADVTNNCSGSSGNYWHLVNELIESDLDGVAFITLNYDLLLESVLAEPTIGGALRSLDWYVRDRWIVGKIHGSVNWGRQIMGEFYRRDDSGHVIIINSTDREDSFLDLVRTQIVRERLSKQIVLLKDMDSHCMEDLFYLPALVLPIEGKYDLLCPEEHQQALKARLPQTTGVLVIGASGRDQDLLDLLSENLPEGRIAVPLHIVGGDDVGEAAHRFSSGVAQLSRGSASIFGEGFRHFVDSRGVERFIEATLEAANN
jgi:hypothetical protein